MKKILIILFLLPITFITAQESKVFTLKQCIDYANANNSNLKISDYQEKIADKKIDEQIGLALPQINITGKFDDNLKIATQLLPGELLGRPGTTIPVQMGTQYNASAVGVLNQMIYDPLFWVNLKTTKISKVLSQQSKQQQLEQVAYDVSTIYYQALIIQKQINILKANLDASQSTLNAVKLQFENGVAKKIDYDKIQVSYNNIKSKLEQTQLSFDQALNGLKFKMGMPVEENLKLTEDSYDIENEYNNDETIDNNKIINNRIDYQLLQTNLKLQDAVREKSVKGFFPTLSGYGSYSFSAQRREFNLFQSSQPWFKSAAVGLQLSIPVFDGLQKSSRIEQSDLNTEIIKENMKLLEQGIKVDLSNAQIQFRNSIDNIKNEKENLKLAEDVYNNTRLEFQQGTGSSIDLIQAETSYREAQNNYIDKLLNLYIARLNLEKSKGTLINFINK